VVDRAGAEALRGARLFVSRSSFPTAGQDEFYWVDLLGLAVFNRDGEHLGDVVGLIDTGPHSVLRVLHPDAGTAEADERLIPFVAAFVDSVSLPQRRISVDWGLDY
jgi:16S rRNA processing protein RimM